MHTNWPYLAVLVGVVVKLDVTEVVKEVVSVVVVVRDVV